MISIIIPSYNVEGYIAQCLDSILKQSVGDIEVIVVDDGSADASFDICEDYASRDARVKLFQQEHSSAGAARNLGLRHATGDYLLFFDADDYMLPGMLEKMLARAEETGTEVVNCRAYSFWDKDGEEEVFEHLGPFDFDYSRVYSIEEYAPRLYQSFVGWSWDKLFRADLIVDGGLEFQDISSTNDAYFVFSALSEASAVSFVDEELMAHRKRVGSIEASRNPHNAKLAFDALLSRLDSRDGDLALLRRSLLNWGLSHQRWNCASFTGEERKVCIDDYHAALELCRGLTEDDLFYYEDKILFRSCIAGEGLAYEIVERAMEMGRLQGDIHWRDGEIARRDEEIARRDEEIARRDGEIAARDGWLADKDRRIAELESTIQERDARIEEILQSSTWKAGRALTAIPRTIKDAGSRKG